MSEKAASESPGRKQTKRPEHFSQVQSFVQQSPGEGARLQGDLH